MLAYTIKPVLELVPEAYQHVKQASLSDNLPMDSKDSVFASALSVKYSEMTQRPIDVFSLDKLAAAVHMYGIENDLEEITSLMIKRASEKRIQEENSTDDNYFLKVASFEGDLPDLQISERSTVAAQLYKEAKDRGLDISDTVVLYSGNGYLSKEAAVKALAVRFDETGNVDFVKLAGAIGRTPDAYLNSDILVDISDKICEMDKIAGLHFKGHNFYKEVFFTKESDFKGSLNITLCGKQVPYESIGRIGKDRIASFIGKDVADEMDGGPQNFKSVVETLPLDLQRVLLNLVNNV